MVQIIHSSTNSAMAAGLSGLIGYGKYKESERERDDRAEATRQQQFKEDIATSQLKLDQDAAAREQESHDRAQSMAETLRQKFAQPGAQGREEIGGEGGLAGTQSGQVEESYFYGPVEGEDWKDYRKDPAIAAAIAGAPADQRQALNLAALLKSSEERDASYLKYASAIGSRLMQQTQDEGVAEQVQRFMQLAANSPVSAETQYNALLDLAKSENSKQAQLNAEARAYQRVTSAFQPLLDNGDLSEESSLQLEGLFMDVQTGLVKPSRAMSAARKILIQDDMDREQIFSPASERQQAAPEAQSGPQAAPDVSVLQEIEAQRPQLDADKDEVEKLRAEQGKDWERGLKEGAPLSSDLPLKKPSRSKKRRKKKQKDKSKASRQERAGRGAQK